MTTTAVKAPLTAQELERLAAITSPTICNAIEEFKIRPKETGFMGPEIKCVFPHKKTMVGYAATCVISAKHPAGKPKQNDLWGHLLSIPGPRIMVVKDLDYPHPIGSLWGEVNANMHKLHGCIGTITDGGVRDLDEVDRLDFHFFSTCLLVSHANVHIEEVGVPVEVGGLVVKPGDLLHADKHGVTNIPLEIARQIPDAVKKVEDMERGIISLCQTPGMTPEKFRETMAARRNAAQQR